MALDKVMDKFEVNCATLLAALLSKLMDAVFPKLETDKARSAVLEAVGVIKILPAPLEGPNASAAERLKMPDLMVVVPVKLSLVPPRISVVAPVILMTKPLDEPPVMTPA